MKATNADWHEALQRLRQGETRPLGELLKAGAPIPIAVAVLLGVMLAPPDDDTDDRLVVEKYKGKKQDSRAALATLVEANKELLQALKKHKGVKKRAFHEVGESRAARGLKSSSRSQLYEFWSSRMPDGALDSVRRELLVASLLWGDDAQEFISRQVRGHRVSDEAENR